MRIVRIGAISVTLTLCALAQETPSLAAINTSGGMPVTTSSSQNLPFDQVIDRTVERERSLVQRMQHLHPIVETYLQNLRSDRDHQTVPSSDQYFLRRLDMSDGADDSFIRASSPGKRFWRGVAHLEKPALSPRGFAQMTLLDNDFQKTAYNFTLVRREFLGEIRCLVVDVEPREHAGEGRFLGRIWIEDQNYNIVRFNGTYAPQRRNSYYFHFDSWRLNLRPGVWLPAYIYSEESGSNTGHARLFHFKAQTRLWGYDLKNFGHKEELTQIEIDPLDNVRDQSEGVQDASPLQAQRLWERQAEENVLARLQQVGLLAPAGEVDQVLEKVVNNLVVTNKLDVFPEPRCRVLLTSPLESFSIGHTIVISRGLLDVLPDESSLAMVLAHELSHIALGHAVNTELAFSDRMFFPDERTLDKFDFNRAPAQEDEADREALNLLEHSPYKDQLGSAGLFLKQLRERASELGNLIHAHLGTGLAASGAMRMSALLNAAPDLETRNVTQIAALPLGGRIKLDPWSDRIELMKIQPQHLVFAQEKKPFEVLPFFPYLTRVTAREETATLLPAQE